MDPIVKERVSSSLTVYMSHLMTDKSCGPSHWTLRAVVLRIRDGYPGSGFFPIPDFSPSHISDPQH